MHRQIVTAAAFLASSSLMVVGCTDHTDGAPAAKVGESAETARKVDPSAAAAAAGAAKAEPVQAPAGDKFDITPTNSKVEFTGAKVTGSHDGGFKDFSGAAYVVADDLAQSSVAITIKTDSLFVDNPKLANHLKSPDFFDVAKFPEASFKSTKIEAKQAKDATHEITGELTLHGVTKSISFPARASLADKAFKASAEFSINRKDFGIVYPGMPDDLIKDLVVIKLDLDLSRS